MKGHEMALHGFHISLANGTVEAGSQVDHLETDRSHVWLINPNNVSINIHALDAIDNVDRHSWDLTSVWSALIQCKATGQYRAISSINGEFSWYYAPDSPGVVSTNIHWVARQTGQSTLDPVSVCTFMAFSWVVGDYSLFKNVKKTYGGSVLEMAPDGFHQKRPDVRAWLGLDDSIADPEEVVKAFMRACENGLSAPQAQVTLTAGADSRAILAAALVSDQPFVAQTGVGTNTYHLDISVARKLARIVGVEHTLVDVRKAIAPPHDHILRSFAQNFSGEVDPINAVIHYKEFIRDENRLSKLTGWGGELYLNNLPANYMRRLHFKLSEFDRTTAAEAKHRIDSRLAEMKELSARDAIYLFHLFEKVRGGASNFARTYLPYCNTYMPFIDSRVLATAFRFNGGISESDLHQRLFAKLPTEAQNIRINLGSRWLWFFHKIRCRYRPNVDTSQLVDAQVMRKTIDPVLFDDVIGAEAIERKIRAYLNGNTGAANALHKLLALQYLYQDASPSLANHH